jgi:hypothetical protein
MCTAKLFLTRIIYKMLLQRALSSCMPKGPWNRRAGPARGQAADGRGRAWTRPVACASWRPTTKQSIFVTQGIGGQTGRAGTALH